MALAFRLFKNTLNTQIRTLCVKDEEEGVHKINILKENEDVSELEFKLKGLDLDEFVAKDFFDTQIYACVGQTDRGKSVFFTLLLAKLIKKSMESNLRKGVFCKSDYAIVVFSTQTKNACIKLKILLSDVIKKLFYPNDANADEKIARYVDEVCVFVNSLDFLQYAFFQMYQQSNTDSDAVGQAELRERMEKKSITPQSPQLRDLINNFATNYKNVIFFFDDCQSLYTQKMVNKYADFWELLGSQSRHVGVVTLLNIQSIISCKLPGTILENIKAVFVIGGEPFASSGDGGITNKLWHVLTALFKKKPRVALLGTKIPLIFDDHKHTVLLIRQGQHILWHFLLNRDYIGQLKRREEIDTELKKKKMRC